MKELKRYLDTRVGEYSFYFEDIDSGYTYGVDERMKMPAASCIKILIAIALLKNCENLRLDLSDKIMVKKEDMVNGSGIIHELDEREYSLKELLVMMIVQNDDTAANKLIDIIGLNSINEQIRKMDLKDTILKRKMMDLKAREKGLENISTSYDLSKTMKIIYNKNYLSDSNSELLIEILKRQQIRDKIPFYIPKREWHNIGNKTGYLNGIENDTALLNIQKGNFVFTVMSKSLPNNVYGIVTISRIGKMMWDIIDRNWK